jgi:hypothetical protein
LALGAAALVVSANRPPLGTAGAILAGGLGALFGATAESLLEGARQFDLSAANVAAAAAGAVALLLVLDAVGGGDAPTGWGNAR